MINLSNGVSFNVIASSGSRGWAGGDEGHGLARAYKAPWHWCSWPDIPVVTKTLTRYPRKGNLTFWRPWRCVQPVSGTRLGGLVNAVGLTNPGIIAWIKDYYRFKTPRRCPIFVSIMPTDEDYAYFMTSLLELSCASIAGIELNLSCPSAGPVNLDKALSLYNTCQANTDLPIIPKFGWQDDYVGFCRTVLDRGWKLPAVHLINCIPWAALPDYKTSPSPLAKYGLSGGVSGSPLSRHSLWALWRMRKEVPQVPVISGGGVMCAQDAITRLDDGAAAVSLGSVYLLRPWRVSGIVKAIQNYINK